jgi:uncharacterized protein HemX
MNTRAQKTVLAIVLAFGAGVLLTLEMQERETQERIHAARREARTECHAEPTVQILFYTRAPAQKGTQS